MSMKIADMHCDTLSKLYFDPNSRLRDRQGHVNGEKLRQGAYVLQNFAVFMERRGLPFFQLCRDMLDLFDREMEENRDLLAPARCYEDIERNMAAGKISAVLTLEDGAAIEGDLSRLSYLQARGVRMLGLTWNFRNALASPNQNDGAGGDSSGEGLTELGIQALGEMERLGIIPDVSHLSDAGFWDLCRHWKGPFVASHSNARAICPHKRNLTDAMLKALADRGGIVGLNFHGPFLDGGRPSFAAAVRQLRHMLRMVGEDGIALGSDFDGIDDAGEFQDAGNMQRFPEALCQAGFTPRLVEKIMYRNLLAFYKETL